MVRLVNFDLIFDDKKVILSIKLSVLFLMDAMATGGYQSNFMNNFELYAPTSLYPVDM